MARLLYRLGAAVHRRRAAVLLAWLVALGGIGASAAVLAGSTSTTVAIPGQESTDAVDRIAEEFGAAGGGTARVVVQAGDGAALTSPRHAAEVAGIVAELSALPGVASASNPLDPEAPGVSPDLTTAYSTVTYTVAATEVPADHRDALREAVADAGGPGLAVEVTGDVLQEAPHVGGVAEVVGVAVALVVLAVTYGGLVLAGLNLLTASVGVAAGVLGITALTGLTELQSTTPVLAAMLGLAVGIDYALFIVMRYRQELRAGRGVGDAVATAVGTAGSAVLTAGLTVVIALAGLAVVGIPFLTEMGVAAAATIVVAVLVALTLVPAALSLLGRRALPRRGRTGAHARTADPATEPPRGLLALWADVVTRRRVTALLLAVAALGVVALPVASMRTTLVQVPAEDSSAGRAERMLADGFGEGFTGPLTVLLEGDGALRAAGVTGIAAADLDGVAAVAPTVPNADGSAALVSVVPDAGPTSEATEQLVADLRDLLDDVVPDGVQASVTGATAVSVDVSTALGAALPVYLALVVGLALVLLVLVFRSLPVPLVGVLGFLLTIGASLGATVAVFQWGWLGDVVNLEATGPLISLAPILVIGILFGLAMDYQVFLVSRMHEARSHGAEPVQAVRAGFRQAAPVVVAAALIMFFVFAGFVPAGDATIKSIAFALAVGIIADALVVRMVLVPAALALLGERAWWLPRALERLPVLDVEGAGLEQLRRDPLAAADGRGGPAAGGTAEEGRRSEPAGVR
jgi:putative drug exporter of the RND superfamily